jgi:hypothetical protein
MVLSLLPGRNNVVHVFPVAYLSMHANLTCIFGFELFLFYLCLYYILLSDPIPMLLKRIRTLHRKLLAF